MLDDDGYEVMEPGSDEKYEFSDIEEAMDDMEQEPDYSDAVDQTFCYHDISDDRLHISLDQNQDVFTQE